MDSHASCRRSADSGMRFRRSTVSMGLPSLSEYDLWRASEEEVRSCARIVHGLAGAFAPPPPSAIHKYFTERR